MADTGPADERTPLLSSTTGSASVPASTAAASDETVSNGTTPLTRTASKDGDDGAADAPAPQGGWLAPLGSPAARVLLAGFIISLSFGFTQVSIFYVFRLMECDVFYSNHPPYAGDGDRCSRNEIAAGTATQFAILGISTTFCGTWNLFVSGHQVKRWGPRAALVLQTFIPAIRVAAQIVGVFAGGQAGIWIIQLTQVITILGGPAGYILVVNTIAGEVVLPIERTALFGKLQGCIMLGVAIGYLLGGIVGDTFGIVRPFQVAFFLFCLSSIYALSTMPYISPESLTSTNGKPGSGSGSGSGSNQKRRGGLAGFFEPLKVLAPQRIRLNTGRVVKHYGVFFLCSGVFLGVTATGYAPILLQMYATATFEFTQANNGWLMAGNGFVRAVFLIFMFPKIIDAGRAWFVRLARTERRQKRELAAAGGGEQPPAPVPTHREHAAPEPATTEIPTEPEQFEAPIGNQAEEEPLLARAMTIDHRHPEDGTVTAVDGSEESESDADKADEEKAAYAFDLFFLRWSLLVDGVITAGAALATQGWHMYLMTVLLPFASGSAPAAKGVITTMCPHSQRADALNAITLVENMARLATLGVFGFLFSALAEVGKAHLTFYCNGLVAMLALAVLMFSHFPPRDSELVEEEPVPAAAADTAEATEA